MGEQFKLCAPNGEMVPPSPKRITPVAVPAGSRCAKHTATDTTVVCARCGTFCCPQCASADLIHCRACLEKELAQQQKDASASVFLVPAAAYMYLGGAIGAVLGLLAGVGAMAFAKRTENKALKILVAVGLYGIAAVVWIVIAAMIQQK